MKRWERREVYGNDRVFVHLRLADEPDTAQKQKLDVLRSAGHPVVEIELADTYDLGQEFFRWEIATAVAGSILKINPFNQPDVEASKIVTRQLTEEYEKSGKLPEESPLFDDGSIKLFTDERNAANLKSLPAQIALSPAFCAHISASSIQAITWRCWHTSR